jgi:hypothetical protein
MVDLCYALGIVGKPLMLRDAPGWFRNVWTYDATIVVELCHQKKLMKYKIIIFLGKLGASSWYC